VPDDFDTTGSREAMLSQFQATNALVARLSEEQACLPTRLGAWRVVELVAHISGSLDFVQRAVATRAKMGTETSPLHWYRNADDFAGFIDEETRAAAAVGWTRVRDSMMNRLVDVTDLLADEDLGRVVVVGYDRMTLEAVCTTRCVEVVLHTLDLVAATSMECHLDARAVELVRRFVKVADNGRSLIRAEL
jgi:uncharacterized protein (TIGR03083 family)